MWSGIEVCACTIKSSGVKNCVWTLQPGGKDCEVHTAFSTCPGYPMVGSETFLLSLVFFSSSQFLEQSVWGLYCNSCSAQRLCHVLCGTWMCLRAVPGGAVSGSACGKGSFFCDFPAHFYKSYSGAVWEGVTVSRGKHQRILIVEQDGQLVA